jgi:hypothetical protein
MTGYFKIYQCFGGTCCLQHLDRRVKCIGKGRYRYRESRTVTEAASNPMGEEEVQEGRLNDTRFQEV